MERQRRPAGTARGWDTGLGLGAGPSPGGRAVGGDRESRAGEHGDGARAGGELRERRLAGAVVGAEALLRVSSFGLSLAFLFSKRRLNFSHGSQTAIVPRLA